MERIHRQCIALAAYMRQSREKLLAAWRQRVEQDPELTTASSITRSQFTDSIPKVLDAFEQALRADDVIRETTGRHGAARRRLRARAAPLATRI